MSNIKTAADIAVKQCLGVKPNEKVLVLTDDFGREIAYALFDAARAIAKDTVLLEITPRETHGTEPQDFVAKLMLDFDVLFFTASKSISHTDARRGANKKGARIGSLPTITKDIFVRALNADYNKIKNLTLRLGKILEEGSLAEIKTDLGTDINIPIKNMGLFLDTGIFHLKGEWGNLPGGEAGIGPEEGKANGIIVFDGTFEELGFLDEPIKATIEDGYCVNLEGGKQVETLKKILCEYGDKRLGKNNPACALAEFGIGTNFTAELSGEILEDEKVYKTVHLAFGNNILYKGKNDVELHLDGLIRKPSVWIDGKQLMNKGEFLI